jgi:hypothetical protein
MNSQQLTDLAFDVMEGRISIDSLPAEQVDAVIMRTYEVAVETVEENPNCSDVVFQIIEALQPAYDDILAEGSDKFEEAIREAEKRGSIFCSVTDFAIQ